MPQEKACHRVERAVARERQIARLHRRPNARPHAIERARDRLGPVRDSSHRVVDSRLIRDETMLGYNVAGAFRETIAISGAGKEGAAPGAAIATGIGRSAPSPALDAY